MLFICTFVSPDSVVIDFLNWFSGTVEVAVDLFRAFRGILPGSCHTQGYVAFPSFHPLLFAVCGESESFCKGKVKEGVSVGETYLVLFAV